MPPSDRPTRADGGRTARGLTMQDVARAAGVSVSTVSRVVNGDRYVGGATRARVEAAVADLGFHPNRMAQKLRPGRPTDTIALVIEDVSNPFYAAIAEGVDSVAQQHRHLLILGTTRRSVDQEREVLAELLRRRVDGLLVVPSGPDHLETYDRLGRWAPMVFIDRRPRGLAGDAVVLDNRGATRRVVTSLVGAGHHRIAYLGGAPSVFTGQRRLAGYRSALADAGIPVDAGLVRLDNHDTAAARSAGLDLLAAARPPTAVFADNNRMTVGLLRAVHESGRDVAVAGYDDVELADLLRVPLTVVSYDATELGRRAAGLLFDRIDGYQGPPRRVTVPTSITHHPTGGPPPARQPDPGARRPARSPG